MTSNNIALQDFLPKIIADFCIIQYEGEDELDTSVYILTEKYCVKQEVLDNKIIKSVKPIRITQSSEIFDAFSLKEGDYGFWIVVNNVDLK